MSDNDQSKGEIVCPVCGGRGLIDEVDEGGESREVVCPICEGRGKVTPTRGRYVLNRLSRRLFSRRLLPRYGRDASSGGGRLRRPWSVLLPLTMEPGADSAGGKKLEDYPDGTGTGADALLTTPDEGYETLSERLDAVLPEETPEPTVESGAGLELEVCEPVPEDQVRREFSTPDAQLEVEQPEVSELIPDESQEATLEVTHESSISDLDYRIEPYPTELFEEVDYDPLDDEPGPGGMRPPGDVGGIV
jgi:hypothetical protein